LSYVGGVSRPALSGANYTKGFPPLQGYRTKLSACTHDLTGCRLNSSLSGKGVYQELFKASSPLCYNAHN